MDTPAPSAKCPADKDKAGRCACTLLLCLRLMLTDAASRHDDARSACRAPRRGCRRTPPHTAHVTLKSPAAVCHALPDIPTRDMLRFLLALPFMFAPKNSDAFFARCCHARYARLPMSAVHAAFADIAAIFRAVRPSTAEQFVHAPLMSSAVELLPHSSCRRASCCYFTLLSIFR